MQTPLDAKKVARTNPAVDAKKIEQALIYREMAEKVGAVGKAGYNVSPPLGTSKSGQKPSQRRVVRMSRAF